jgi:hypothetical protein
LKGTGQERGSIRRVFPVVFRLEGKGRRSCLGSGREMRPGLGDYMSERKGKDAKWGYN